MDRLEEIKKIMKAGINEDDMLYGLLEVTDEEWLIAAIEQLRKEKEWLINKLIDAYQRKYATDMPEAEMREMVLCEMQQTLKDK